MKNLLDENAQKAKDTESQQQTESDQEVKE